MKEQGLANDLVSRIAADPLFGLTEEDIRKELDPAKYVGRAPAQVTEFIAECVQPVLERYADLIDNTQTELKV